MGSIVVDVMLKSEILDPQGQAVAGALPRLGFDRFTSVRQGKHFVLTVDGDVTPALLEEARKAAETLLSNPVMEDVVSVRAETPMQAAVDWDDDEDIDWELMHTGSQPQGAKHDPVALASRTNVGHDAHHVLADAGFVDIDDEDED